MRKYTYHVDGSDDRSKIFVFGSNRQGVHGAGAALHAYHYRGAIYGDSVGPMGNSYAIPTKHSPSLSMSVNDIHNEVDSFIEYALNHPEKQFFVTRIGCGLAGYDDCIIAPMFVGAPSNCDFPQEWEFFLENM